MMRQAEKFLAKLELNQTGRSGRMAFMVNDDRVVGVGPDDLCETGRQLLQRLNVLAIALVEPSLPFADFLIRNSRPDESCLVPRDTETRTFLHDIPFVRKSELEPESADQLAALLGNRKGILVEGLGIIATGTVTPEQAYINISSVFHSVFVKYLLDLLRSGFVQEDERSAFSSFRYEWLKPLTVDGLGFSPAAELLRAGDIYREIAEVGRCTVRQGLVDSFFGNISCRAGEMIYISQTAASLDELEGCIDPVPFDNSSTCGITASSELLAHRQVYETTGAQTLLHGHPKFSVIMSMLCETENCPVEDCWKDCPHVRKVDDIPIVAGEVGAGGLADRISPVIGAGGKVIVFGHGVFAIGHDGFRDSFAGLVQVEQWCRDEYFRMLDANG